MTPNSMLIEASTSAGLRQALGRLNKQNPAGIYLAGSKNLSQTDPKGIPTEQR
jgi:hypothetical protein